jgi:hypothetical protein
LVYRREDAGWQLARKMESITVLAGHDMMDFSAASDKNNKEYNLIFLLLRLINILDLRRGIQNGETY